MNPQTNQDTGLNLPTPGITAATMPLPNQVSGVPAQGVSGGFDAAQAPVTPIAPIAPQSMGQQNPPVPTQAPPLTMPAVGAPIQSPGAPRADYSGDTAVDDNGAALSSAVASLPAEAADSDVIEKEWVVKAKQVVAETLGDPYKQVRELNKLRADYMKKRYNKDLKLPDA